MPKATLEGEAVIAERKFAVTFSGPFIVMVVKALLGLATALPVQLEKT